LTLGPVGEGMTRGAWGRRSVAAGGWLAIYFILCAASSQAGTTTIYKCLDNDLALVYTDEPCKEGERLELRPGEADPEAVARLERVRGALDREALERATDARRAIIGNEGTFEIASGDDTGAYDYGPAYVSSGGILHTRLRIGIRCANEGFGSSSCDRSHRDHQRRHRGGERGSPVRPGV
jgi:hypothetical protein